MDMPTERVPETKTSLLDDAAVALPLDPAEALDLHRAINERRAQVEKPELLRGIRAL
ncbi:MAG: hypothetical protein AB1942_05350 [Pseudomonadota bacterium]